MFVMYQDCLSPHQLPLARELVRRLGEGNFRYVYRDQSQLERVTLGWNMKQDAAWQLYWFDNPESASELIETADVLLTGFRSPDLFNRRKERGLTTLYASERWFKPIVPRVFDFEISGFIRMFHLGYFKMACKMKRWLAKDPKGYYLYVGPWAKKDMLKLGVDEEKMIPWGYFVKPSTVQGKLISRSVKLRLKILYLGRLLRLKRVDTVLRAVAHLRECQKDVLLSIVGSGPEELVLRDLVNKLSLKDVVTFSPSVPIEKTREIIRSHDVLVFSSNALDGWGAVVSEALEEGVPVVGTYETGASSTLLPKENLYSCGDYKALAQSLLKHKPCPMPSDFTAAGAAKRLIKLFYISREKES